MDKPMNEYAADAPRVLRDFLTYISTIRGKSAKTAHEYYLDLRLFFRVLKHNKGAVDKNLPLDEIDISDIDLDFIRDITLSDTYDYLEAPTVRKSLPTYLTTDDSVRLLESVTGPYAERDYCILTFFLNCGMRVSELVGLNLTDFKDDTVRVLGKGGKQRTVFLNDACLAALEQYLPKRLEPNEQDADALYVSKKRNRINVQTVKWLVKKYIGQAGLDPKKYSAHKLRHTAATLMYQNGVDIRTLQSILGHSSVDTTMIYTHIENENMREAAARNPLAEIRPNGERVPVKQPKNSDK